MEGDSLFLYLTERPIYGSARIGVNMRRVKLSASLANQYDPPARAMQITTVMYDSPSSHKDAPEVNDGEYVGLLNTSNDTLDLGAYRLRNLLTNDNWTMTGMGSVAPGQRILLANYPSGGAASFKTLSLVTDQDLAEGDIRLADSLGISLWDSAGAIVIEDTFGILHDRMNYGEYFGLDARNAYVATASLGNLGDREPMQAVYRTAGLARPVGGTTPQVWVITTTGTMAGEVSLSPLPEGYNGSETGTYALERGGTAYEFTNHLGNVLAVVSDKKLGQGGTTLAPFSTYYHPETGLLTDYYPFGSPMVGRTWQSGGYRYGFNGMQKDNEVVGEANGYDFGARLYDGRVGRWWSVDPMAKYYPEFSPYHFALNNPLMFLDEGGLGGNGGFDIENQSSASVLLVGTSVSVNKNLGLFGIDWLAADEINESLPTAFYLHPGERYRVVKTTHENGQETYSGRIYEISSGELLREVTVGDVDFLRLVGNTRIADGQGNVRDRQSIGIEHSYGVEFDDKSWGSVGGGHVKLGGAASGINLGLGKVVIEGECAPLGPQTIHLKGIGGVSISVFDPPTPGGGDPARKEHGELNSDNQGYTGEDTKIEGSNRTIRDIVK